MPQKISDHYVALPSLVGPSRLSRQDSQLTGEMLVQPFQTISAGGIQVFRQAGLERQRKTQGRVEQIFTIVAEREITMLKGVDQIMCRGCRTQGRVPPACS